MTTAATSLLGLALPVTGELAGTWGDTVNNSITSLLDSAVAGTTTLSTDGDVTLTTTTLAANQARQAILLCSGSRTALRTITAPAQSKIYTIINATTGGFSVKLVGAGPTTGVTIVAGESAVCAWNGSDFIKISNTGGSASFTNVTVSGTTTLSGLTASTALALNSSKEVVSVTNTGTGNNVLSASPTLTGTVGAAALTLSSDLTLSGGTANGVLYLNGSKVATSGSALTFDGTNFATTGKIGAGGSPGTYTQIWSSGNIMAADGSQIGFLASSSGAPANYMTGSNTSNYLAWIANNSEAMRLTSTGLGIGTSSPAARLHVLDSNSSGTMRLGGATYYGSIQHDASTTGANIYNSQDTGGHLFQNSGSTVLTLNNSGNLGLGVTPSAWSASWKGFQIAAGSDGLGVVAIASNNVYLNLATNAYYDTSWKYKNDGKATDYSQNNGQHEWYIAASGTAGNAITFTQAMTLDASGNLGVGTTSPGHKLHVAGGDGDLVRFAGSTRSLYFAPDSGGVMIATGAAQTGVGTYYSHASQLMYFMTNSTERARIDSSGNLGIGTTSPGTRLQLNGTDGTSGLFIQKAGAAQSFFGAESTWLGTGTSNNTVINAYGANNLLLAVNGTERARIDSSGNLGIGTSSPVTKLHVQTDSATGTYLRVQNTEGQLYAGVKSSGAGYIATETNDILELATNGTVRATIDTSGNLGLGVTPSAWSGPRAFQFGAAGAVYASGNDNYFASNVYFDGTNFKRIAAAASGIFGYDGTWKWLIAGSSTAGSTATFTQAMTLDASGNLGLGTTSTSGAKFRVLGSSSGGGKAYIDTNGTFSGTDTATLGFSIYQDSGVRYNSQAEICCIGDGNYSGSLAFFTQNSGTYPNTVTERARITSSGNFLVGTTTDVSTVRMQVWSSSSDNTAYFRNSNATPYGPSIKYTVATPNNTGSEFLYCEDSTALRTSIRSNGGIANYQGNDVNLSDRREKTNFAPAKSYLETICAIPVQTFSYIDQSEDDPGLTLGVVAQDVQAVAPELVVESNWGTEEDPKMRLSIYQTDLQYALMKCIQEQQALIETLTARVASLESK